MKQKEMLQNIHYCVMLGLSEKTKEKVNFSYGDLCLRFKVCSMRKEC